MRQTPSALLRSWFLALVLFFSMAGWPHPVGANPAQPPRDSIAPAGVEWQGQLRAFWVDIWNDGIKSPAQIEQLIADAHTANANALFVQVRRRGEVDYNDGPEPRDGDPNLTPWPFDPLASLIEAAHNANPPLQVHAWIVTLNVWNSGYESTDPERHVYYLHGCGWECYWDDPQNWLSYGYNGADLVPSEFLDPGHPGAAQYTVDLCTDLVRRYNVDGLHLDYIRYQEEWDNFYYGYNKTSIDRFNAAYGREGLPDPHDEQWMAWRRQQVTELVRRIYLETLAIRPSMVLSVAAIAWADAPYELGWEQMTAYRRVFQDWRAWLEEGIIDLAMPMDYQREDNDLEWGWYWNWIEWQKDHQYGRGVVIGPGPFLNHVWGGINQIWKAIGSSQEGNYPVGVAIYDYALTNVDGIPNSDFYAALSQPSDYYGDPPFPTWVNPPVLPWKANPTTGYLMGLATDSDSPLAGVEVTLTGPVQRTIWTDGNGFFGAANLPPGNYRAEITAPVAKTFVGAASAGQVTRMQLGMGLQEIIIGPDEEKGEKSGPEAMPPTEAASPLFPLNWAGSEVINATSQDWLNLKHNVAGQNRGGILQEVERANTEAAWRERFFLPLLGR